MDTTALLALVVVTALAFDFTNGFHDTANAMATSIATGALRPKAAVALSAVLNVLGAFLSLAVAATIASGIVEQDVVTLSVVFAGLTGGILWNLVTWYFGLPSSSSHALIGGLVGSVLVAAGTSGVIWSGLVSKVAVPAVVAPVAAGLVATCGTWLVYRITRGVARGDQQREFRWGQIGSASLVSLAHGTNDAQKTMGIIFLALIAGGQLDADDAVPLWVVIGCAGAIGLGTYLGGWRVIRTLGKGLTELEPPQGMAAETSSAAVILVSSHFGFPLSTTHVASGSIMGSGVGRRTPVRWSVARRMVVAWLVTLPAAAAVGAAAEGIQHALGGWAGTLVVLALLVAASLALFLRSRRTAVGHHNVNDDWAPDASPAQPTAAASAA
ncbi:inorganic phosphate transporter family protein [Cellulomonas sp. DKR-3]|uniref:Phosphate transporter n=1 Tax=Cellulomonas fulva TaxID=2835530 RepID=A0ABS5TZD5_9CELL|nr:inorganic phosphate transporter [Cellulomonas fulva]MBT0994513.1 inorganic phosphate transporter family protein [Cellulomonas fulva]